MIEKAKEVGRALAAYHRLFEDDVPALNKEQSKVVIEVMLQLAGAAGALKEAAGGQLDVRELMILTRLVADLGPAGVAIAEDAGRCERHFELRSEHLVDTREAEALVEAIELRLDAKTTAPAAAPKDKLAQAIGALAKDLSLALLDDTELARRLGVHPKTFYKPNWELFRRARSEALQREAPPVVHPDDQGER